MSNKTDISAGVRVSAICSPEYSIGHNLRLKDYVESQKKHIDFSRKHYVYLNMGDEKETYDKLFKESIEEYNKTQKRKDRKINDYLQQVIEDKRAGKHKNVKANSDRKPFYEFIFYLGNRDFHCPDDKAERILRLYATKIMPKKFPNFIPTHINGHNDEFSFDRKGNRIESPFHLHVTGVYVAHALTKEELKKEYEYREKVKELKKKELEKDGIPWNEEKWKKKDWRLGMITRWGKSLEKGMSLQTSMSAACAEMGFFTQKGKGTAQQQFEEAVRYDLMDFAESMGVKVNRTKGYSHKHDEIDIYKAKQNIMDSAVELELRRQNLNLQEIELQNKIDDYDYQFEHLEELMDKNKKNTLFLNKKNNELNEYAQKLDKRSKDLDNKEKIITQKSINSDNQMEESKTIYNQALEYNQNAENYYSQAKLILLENQNKMDNFNAENRERIIEIENWKEAAKEINDSESWVKPVFNEYDSHKNETNSLNKLYHKVIDGIKGVIAKVKEAYDEKINKRNEMLFGSKKFSVEGDKVVVTYSYGSEDIKEMFCATPVDDISEALKECKSKGKRTIGEMIKDEGLSFLEKHFKKAKDLTRERNIELERFAEKHQVRTI